MTISTSLLKRTTWLAAGLGLLMTGCAHNGESAPDALSATNIPPPKPELTNRSGSNDDDQAALNAAFDNYVKKQREDRIRGIPLPPSQFPFPNYDAGPLRPAPCYVNFYRINDHYPDYLLCQYDVDVTNYDQSSNPKLFAAALDQIRQSGLGKFPPIKWVAITIFNRVEEKDLSTTDQAYKVGAIFKADDVFDSSVDLSQLVAKATMDRHPFFLDLKKTDLFPAEQQRWIIVEQHAATNHPAGTK